MPSRCPDEDTELLGDSGLAAAVKARGGDGPELALAKPRPSRGPAGGRAVLHDPEMARAYSKLLHSPAPLSFLQSWFPAGPAALRLKEGLSLVSGVAGKDIPDCVTVPCRPRFGRDTHPFCSTSVTQSHPFHTILYKRLLKPPCSVGKL